MERLKLRNAVLAASHRGVGKGLLLPEKWGQRPRAWGTPSHGSEPPFLPLQIREPSWGQQAGFGGLCHCPRAFQASPRLTSLLTSPQPHHSGNCTQASPPVPVPCPSTHLCKATWGDSDLCCVELNTRMHTVYTIMGYIYTINLRDTQVSRTKENPIFKQNEPSSELT